VTLQYRREGDRWVPPRVFIRLRNTTGRSLYCVLLDLTDSYRIHADLFPGGTLAERHVVAADHGRPIEVSLPAGRPPEPGQTVTDWLKLLVAERSFASSPFYLPRLGEPARIASNRSSALSGVLDRLGYVALHRGDPGSGPATDWTTELLTVVTQIPGAAGPC
jgi:hypothetical protein